MATEIFPVYDALMRVLLSPFQNPFLNLALEDHFLRGGADLPVLFLYINRPCVVLGRFQNPWLETQLPYLVDKDIWMVRRQSGGGCVFHDEGNLNFSFITPDPMINRMKYVEVLQHAFAKADIPLTISSRHDLWLEGRKISGSAFKQTKDGSFHHGTFLVSSDLEKLEESLKHTLVPSQTKSIASVRSQVVTLQEKFPGTEIDDVIEIICHHLKTIPFTLDGTILSDPQVLENFRNLLSWEWLWGETPLFEFNGLTIRKGFIEYPISAKFDKKNAKDYFSESELGRLFPDLAPMYVQAQRIF
jgi:lipoate-protein ligase A